MSHITNARVTAVEHLTDRLFSFTTTRDPGLRFHSGQFIMLGLEVNGRPLLRAYSIASAPYEDELGFLSIKVPDGPLTSRLQHLRPGDEILLGRKPTGTLVPELLEPGERLYLFATGTGLAPFLSLIRDPDIYARFEQIVLVHGCRHAAELAFRRMITEELPQHELLGAEVCARLRYVPTVTREPFPTRGRIDALIEDGRLAAMLDLPPLDPAADRAMLCGSPAMLASLRTVLEARGFAEGSHASPGQFVVERAFAER
ncbi:MAG: ferredoxin--NADP reductase [Rhodospirillales bacterium]|jgi:ferredoxin--NADP+ reductase|nr:ferredoxin--NADP reductase [Rhodospirillales bacterium]